MSGNRKRTAVKIIGLAVILTAIYPLAQIFYSDIHAAESQRKLHNEWNKILRDNKTSSQAAAKPTRISHGKPFTRMVIPRINLDAIVLEGTDEDTLRQELEHIEGTAYPGEIGNVVISGHRVTYNRPFYSLGASKKGNPIYVYVPPQEFTYYVVGQKVVKPTDVSIADPIPDKTLTLTTCNLRFSARERLIIAKMR